MTEEIGVMKLANIIIAANAVIICLLFVAWHNQEMNNLRQDYERKAIAYNVGYIERETLEFHFMSQSNGIEIKEGKKK